MPVSASEPSLRTTAESPPPTWIPAACLAVVVPTLLAFNLPPSATFLNQAAAFIGWGVLVAVLAAAPGVLADLPWRGPQRSLLGALALMALAAAAAPFWAGLPWTLALSALGTLGATALAVMTGAALARAGRADAAFHAFAVALLATGVIGAAIGFVQVFVPQWADGVLIASISGGRAAGNLRQPNHLSSLLLWALIALAWHFERGRIQATAASLLGLLLTAGIVLTGSRTGTLGMLMLAGWGWRDRQTLSRQGRRALLLAPVAYAVLWATLAASAHLTQHEFGGDAQLAKGDISSSRFGIWSNTLSLIASHPWFGVGWGEFNFAWTLSPFPDRPVAFFDHTHNLLLQFAVELGLPLALLVLALLGCALWLAWKSAPRSAEPSTAIAQRAAFMVVLMMAVHSQFEYPLWYAYFLLPTAFAFGLCLGGEAPAAPSTGHGGALRAAAAVLVVGAGLSVWDYHRVVVIYAPGGDAAPLADRIAEGQRSWFFGHHADYADVTTASVTPDPDAAFARVTHYLLDTRLMTAWARSLEAAGHDDAARTVAQRLREFRNPQAEPFFEVCDMLEGEATDAAPFQCRAPSAPLAYEAFRR